MFQSYKEFINEKENNLWKLAWSKKSYEHALKFRVPITTKIGKLLNNGTKITSFHTTSINNILNIKSLIGKKKSLSTFTKMEKRYLGDMHGVQSEGGILFQFESDLLIKSDYDIMSRPDEQGRRWVDIHDLKDAEFFETKWFDFVKEINDKFPREWQELLIDASQRNNVAWIKENSVKISEYLYYYIKRAEEYVLNNKRTFLMAFNVESGSSYYYWDEVLVNNIKVKDVLLYYKFDDANFVDNIVARFGSLDKLKELFNSFIDGQIYVTFNPNDAIEFVEKRSKD